MSNYDSILKEKKTYEEETVKKDEGPKPFPWLKIDLLCLSLILIISYIIYYNSILTPKQIFLNDLKIVTDKYQSILNYTKIKELVNDNYNIKGTINLNEKNYNYQLNKYNDKLKINLILDNETLNYYMASNEAYLKIPNFKEEYYKKTTNTNYFNVISSLKSYLTNTLTEKKFIKKFYLTGTTPIVESNLVLNNEDIKTALNHNINKNSYEVLFTFKNNALTNKIISMKITINNQTTNERGVILYENNYLTFKDDNNNLKFELEKNNDDFRLNIYQNDILFSVLTGTKKETSYQYLYQVIDEIYNITLNIKAEDNITTYEIISNIEKEETIHKQNLTLTIEPTEDIFEENTDITNPNNYTSLTKEEQNQYKNKLNDIIVELKQFILELNMKEE